MKVQNKVEQADGIIKKTTEKRCLQGVSWKSALESPMEKRNMKRLSPLLPILRGKDCSPLLMLHIIVLFLSCWIPALATTTYYFKNAYLQPLISAVVERFEAKEGREAVLDDLPVLESEVNKLIKEEGITGNLDIVALSSFLGQTEEMPAINAILGGVVANDVIKIVASKGEPIIHNLFLYSLFDGAGWVELLGQQKA